MCAIKTDIRSASNPRLYYVTCISMTVAHLALHTVIWGHILSEIEFSVPFVVQYAHPLGLGGMYHSSAIKTDIMSAAYRRSA